jgi:hypothetical protein
MEEINLRKNLDQLCAEYGYKFGNKISESLLRTGLGILQEQGFYALLLYFNNKKEDNGETALDLIGELIQEDLDYKTKKNLLKEFSDKNGVFSDLETLIFLIQIIERCLIYALFHSKANSNSKNRE